MPATVHNEADGVAWLWSRCTEACSADQVFVGSRDGKSSRLHVSRTGTALYCTEEAFAADESAIANLAVSARIVFVNYEHRLGYRYSNFSQKGKLGGCADT